MMMHPEFPQGLSVTDFWIVEAKGIEAQYIISALAKPVLAKVPIMNHPVLFTEISSKERTYYLRKTYFTVEDITKATGVPTATVARAPMIKLHVSPVPGLPEPTVDYWGRA